MQNHIVRIGFKNFMEAYPHNNMLDNNSFQKLIKTCYNHYCNGKENVVDVDVFIQDCVNAYGGTVAESMVEYLWNKINFA